MLMFICFQTAYPCLRLLCLYDLQGVGAAAFAHTAAAGDDVLVAAFQYAEPDQFVFYLLQGGIVVGTGFQVQRAHAAIHGHAALGGGAGCKGVNRDLDAVAADLECGRATFSQGDNGFGVHFTGNMDGTARNGMVDVVVVVEIIYGANQRILFFFELR